MAYEQYPEHQFTAVRVVNVNGKPWGTDVYAQDGRQLTRVLAVRLNITPDGPLMELDVEDVDPDEPEHDFTRGVHKAETPLRDDMPIRTYILWANTLDIEATVLLPVEEAMV